LTAFRIARLDPAMSGPQSGPIFFFLFLAVFSVEQAHIVKRAYRSLA
jgi:hypothetical protein